MASRIKNVDISEVTGMIRWEELDRWAPCVEKEGLDHVLYMEGLVIKADKGELIWE